MVKNEFSIGQTYLDNKTNKKGVCVFAGKTEVHLRSESGFMTPYRLDDKSTDDLTLVSEECLVELVIPEGEKSPQKSTIKTGREPKAGTKVDLAMQIYLANKDKSRKDVIAMFMSELKMTDAGAATYYANTKKKATSSGFKDRKITSNVDSGSDPGVLDQLSVPSTNDENEVVVH